MTLQQSAIIKSDATCKMILSRPVQTKYARQIYLHVPAVVNFETLASSKLVLRI